MRLIGYRLDRSLHACTPSNLDSRHVYHTCAHSPICFSPPQMKSCIKAQVQVCGDDSSSRLILFRATAVPRYLKILQTHSRYSTMPSQEANLAAVVPATAKDLVIQERQIPAPGSDEILVRNHAVGINPVDWKRQIYGFNNPSYPLVLGSGEFSISFQIISRTRLRLTRSSQTSLAWLPQRVPR